jgi:hypothetical protein
MSKKPRRQKKVRTEGIKRPRQGAPEGPQANVHRLTTKAWAASAQVLEQRRDLVAVLDLMGFFHWLGDRNLRTIMQGLPPLPCRAGCSYCCHVGVDMPDLLPAEVLPIVSFLTSQGAPVIDEVKARIRDVDAVDAGPASGERTAVRLPCLFLAQDRCLIYPVRPMRCRAQHSPDVEACRQNYLGQRETIPLLSEPALLYKTLQVGLRLGLEQAGLQDTPLAMRRAIAAALEQSDVFERWLDGEPAFESAMIPDEADEKRSLARFARQERAHMEAERAGLGKLTVMFIAEPGRWAAYSITGRAPRLVATAA